MHLILVAAHFFFFRPLFFSHLPLLISTPPRRRARDEVAVDADAADVDLERHLREGVQGRQGARVSNSRALVI